MKLSHHHSRSIPLLRISRLSFALAALAALSACTSAGHLFRTSGSALPIETIGCIGGQVVSARAFESSDELYASGNIRITRGRQIPYSAHVDVQLIGAEGQVIASKRDDIEPADPRSASGRSGRYSYVASFPLSVARQAKKIVVRYHLAVHRA